MTRKIHCAQIKDARLNNVRGTSVYHPMKPVTLLLALANVLVYLAAPAVDAYGFVPAHASVQAALASTFMHADLGHLLGNMVFLLVFGTIVERDLGTLRFTLIYVAAGLGGALLHAFVEPSSTLVGASGCLFGVMAAAAMLRPRLLVFVLVFAAFNALALALPETIFAMPGVSTGAHLGGFATGFLMTRTMFAGKIEEVRS
jgi:membrane associated rhomboid family serine protease